MFIITGCTHVKHFANVNNCNDNFKQTITNVFSNLYTLSNYFLVHNSIKNIPEYKKYGYEKIKNVRKVW